MNSNKRFIALSVTAAVYVAIVLVTAPDYTLSANLLLVPLVVTAATFVVLYAVRSNWRLTAAGRAIMVLIACIAAICGVGVLNAFLGDYAAKPFIRLSCFLAVGLTLMNLLLTLVAAQRDREDAP